MVLSVTSYDQVLEQILFPLITRDMIKVVAPPDAREIIIVFTPYAGEIIFVFVDLLELKLPIIINDRIVLLYIESCIN